MLELMRVSEIARRLGIKSQAVLGLIARERIPATMVGTSYVIRCEDFEVYRLEKLAQAKAQVEILRAARLT